MGHLEGRGFFGLDPFCRIKYFKRQLFWIWVIGCLLLIKTRWRKMKKPSRFFQANFLRLFWPPNGLRGHIWPHHEQSMAFAYYVDMFSEARVAYMAFLWTIKDKKKPRVDQVKKYSNLEQTIISTPKPLKVEGKNCCSCGRHIWLAIPFAVPLFPAKFRHVTSTARHRLRGPD